MLNRDVRDAIGDASVTHNSLKIKVRDAVTHNARICAHVRARMHTRKFKRHGVTYVTVVI